MAPTADGLAISGAPSGVDAPYAAGCISSCTSAMWLADMSAMSAWMTDDASCTSHGKNFGLSVASASMATASGTDDVSVSIWYTMFSRAAVHETAAPSRSASRTIMSCDFDIELLKAMCCSTCAVPETLSYLLPVSMYRPTVAAGAVRSTDATLRPLASVVTFAGDGPLAAESVGSLRSASGTISDSATGSPAPHMPRASGGSAERGSFRKRAAMVIPPTG